MTLKEKFLPKMYCFFGSGMLTNSYDEKVAEDNAKQCEQIADEFAIGFAQWFHENCYEDNVGYYKAEELLQTYKKQKGS